jgi:hypothetical protein
VLVALVWGLYYGRLVETPPEKVCFVWVTPAKITKTADMTDQEYQALQKSLDRSQKDVDTIMQAFEEKYSDFGFEKYKTQMQAISNNDEKFNFNMFNQHDGDISILPIDYFLGEDQQGSEDQQFTQLKDLSIYKITSVSNVEYLKGLNYNNKKIKVAIKLNSHYAMAVSINASAPRGAIEKLINLALDVI